MVIDVIAGKRAKVDKIVYLRNNFLQMCELTIVFATGLSKAQIKAICSDVP